jgi:hypothetical protein
MNPVNAPMFQAFSEQHHTSLLAIMVTMLNLLPLNNTLSFWENTYSTKAGEDGQCGMAVILCLARNSLKDKERMSRYTVGHFHHIFFCKHRTLSM